ncbi:MAG: hypothetical protein ACLU7B_00810, partial [Bifidobacterium adolescentis]
YTNPSTCANRHSANPVKPLRRNAFIGVSKTAYRTPHHRRNASDKPQNGLKFIRKTCLRACREPATVSKYGRKAEKDAYGGNRAVVCMEV